MAVLEVDITGAIETLRGEKATRHLAKLLAQRMNLMSIEADLRRAQRALNLLVRHSNQREKPVDPEGHPLSDDELLLDASLTMFVIIAYARCTDTTSNVRGRFDPRKYYTDEERLWHDSLIDLRNEAVAHFGAGKHRGGPWASDRLLLRHDTVTKKTAVALRFERIGYRAAVVNELQILLPKAIAGLLQNDAALARKIQDEISAHEQAWLAAIAPYSPQQVDSLLTEGSAQGLHRPAQFPVSISPSE